VASCLSIVWSIIFLLSNGWLERNWKTGGLWYEFCHQPSATRVHRSRNKREMLVIKRTLFGLTPAWWILVQSRSESISIARWIDERYETENLIIIWDSPSILTHVIVDVSRAWCSNRLISRKTICQTVSVPSNLRSGTGTPGVRSLTWSAACSSSDPDMAADTAEPLDFVSVMSWQEQAPSAALARFCFPSSLIISSDGRTELCREVYWSVRVDRLYMWLSISKHSNPITSTSACTDHKTQIAS
jgi:hypothetical protein